MTTDYAPIATRYRRTRQSPWTLHVESYLLMRLAEPVQDKRVLDLACGGGHYARMFAQRGAISVVGVDRSRAMIELARRQEAEIPRGICYRCEDASAFEAGEPFDLAMAAYVLDQARNATQLRAYYGAVARSLAPDGRFVTVTTSPVLDFASAPSFRRYGFEAMVDGPLYDGAEILWRRPGGDGATDVSTYRFGLATHARAARQAGFREMRWHQPRVAPQGLMRYGPDYWAPLLEHSPIAFLECRK